MANILESRHRDDLARFRVHPPGSPAARRLLQSQPSTC